MISVHIVTIRNTRYYLKQNLKSFWIGQDYQNQNYLGFIKVLFDYILISGWKNHKYHLILSDLNWFKAVRTSYIIWNT